MATNTMTNETKNRISIQINNEKVARVFCDLSISAAELRRLLISEKTDIPLNAKFLDKDEYPIVVNNERLIKINDLFKINNENNEKIIYLKTVETSTPIDRQHSKSETPVKSILFGIVFIIVGVIIAPYFRNGNPMSKKTPHSSGSDTYVETKEHLKEQIELKPNGTEILVDTDKGLTKIDSSVYDQGYAKIISDWKTNSKQYQEDYKWYNAMSSPGGVCAGTFNERVVFSMKTIENTPESIKIFTEKNFQGWPQRLIDRINIKYELSGIDNEDGGVTEYTDNGKISDNLYLVAWKREENNTIIRIQTYNVIFERTAGQSCKFNETYFSKNRGRVINAKKYFLLEKVEENPLYKKFLLSQSQQQIA